MGKREFGAHARREPECQLEDAKQGNGIRYSFLISAITLSSKPFSVRM